MPLRDRGNNGSDFQALMNCVCRHDGMRMGGKSGMEIERDTGKRYGKYIRNKWNLCRIL